MFLHVYQITHEETYKKNKFEPIFFFLNNSLACGKVFISVFIKVTTLSKERERNNNFVFKGC